LTANSKSRVAPKAFQKLQPDNEPEDTIILGSQQYYREKGEDGKSIKLVNAIRRAKKSIWTGANMATPSLINRKNNEICANYQLHS